MRFVKIPQRTRSSVTAKGVYTNSKGKQTHHRKKSETPVKFVGVDGEGVTVNAVDSNGVCERVHRYVLFGVGDQQISNPTGLGWGEVFDFLYARNRPGTAFVGFFLGYDFTQIFKTLTESRATMLLTTEGKAKRKHRIAGKTPHPVEGRTETGARWHFDVLGMKRLRLRPKACDCEIVTCQCKQRPWMYVCDVGSYFQTSFLKAIDPTGWSEGTAIVSKEEYATIQTGKQKRSTAVLDADMRHYNVLENQVLSRVMATLDAGLHEIGIHLPPSKWFGPGQAAQAWLKAQNVPTRVDIESAVPDWYCEAARMSYYGGWFEQFIHGIIPGVSHEYDINSAYPHVISTLPCLLHGKYSRGTGIPTIAGNELCLVYGNVWAPGMPSGSRTQYVGSMLHRDPSGRILRPWATEGWFWWDELQAAHRAGLVKRIDNRGKQQIKQWVKYEPCDCPPPMEAVRNLYTRRLQVGKATPLGKVAKLVYNSMYGKFAQSLGEPVFGNAVYASRITAGTRIQILDAIATHPKGIADVSMVATDAVYFLTPHPGLTMGEALGVWEHKERSTLTLFKPGVYWDDKTRRDILSGHHAAFKARGFQAADFHRSLGRVDEIYRRWDTLDDRALHHSDVWPTVTFRASFSMTTALQALRQNDWTRAGRVSDGTILTQSADPYSKRQGLYRSEGADGRTVYRSEPHYGMVGTEGRLEWVASTPYSKRFGMEDPWSDEYKEQHGITPDGNVGDVLMWILNGT
jgi:hypothetical protein